MPNLIVTAVFEGAPVDDLAPGRPIPGLAIEVGGVGRDSVTATTDPTGSATVVLPEAGSWTVSASQQRDAGSLLGLMTIDVNGEFAMLALPVRWRPV